MVGGEGRGEEGRVEKGRVWCGGGGGVGWLREEGGGRGEAGENSSQERISAQIVEVPVPQIAKET